MKASLDSTILEKLRATRPAEATAGQKGSRAIFDQVLASQAGNFQRQAINAQMPALELLGPDLSTKAEPMTVVRQEIGSLAGQSMDQIALPSEKRAEVEEFLKDLGLSPEESSRIVSQATDTSGQIRLGPTVRSAAQIRRKESKNSGPVLPGETIPQFLGLMEKMGLRGEDLDQLTKELGHQTIPLRRLTSLLNKIKTKPDGKLSLENIPEVKNLLVKAGLKEVEADRLIARHVGQSGSLNFRGLFNLLADAASQNDQAFNMVRTGQLKQQLTSLLQGAKAVPAQDEQTRDADLTKKLNHLKADNKRLRLVTGSERTKPADKDLIEQVKAVLLDKAGSRSPEDSLEGNREALAARIKAIQIRPETDRPAAAASGNRSASGAQAAKSTELAQGASFREVLTTAAAKTAQVARMNPSVLLEQLAGRMTLMVKAGQSALRLQLEPPELGQMRIDLQVEGQSVKATLVAESAQVQRILAAQGSELRQSLADQGLVLDRLDITVKDQNGGQDGRQESPEDRHQSSGGRAAESADQVQSEEARPNLAAVWAGRSNLVSVVV